MVKYGGNAMISPELKSAVMSDIVLMRLVGVNVVLVHGGGPEISQMLKKQAKKANLLTVCVLQTVKQWILFKWCLQVR